MRHLIIYESFNEDSYSDNWDRNAGDVEKDKEELVHKGEYKLFLGTHEQILKFMEAGSPEADLWREMMSDTEVRVLLTKDKKILKELMELVKEFGLVQHDFN